MASASEVSAHYTHGNLIDAIERGLQAMGKSHGNVTIDDLAPLDEFHIGGRAASEHFLDQIEFAPGSDVLDVGCGLGGTSRFVASRYGCRVTGIDLTAEFIDTAKMLSRWVGLQSRTTFHQGNALALSFPDGAFDGAYMLHVGMNIADKKKLCAEASKVLRAGARFGIYDVMRTAVGDLVYPVPWAATGETSAVAEPAHYRRALQAAGFEVIAEHERRDFALAFFNDVRARTAAAGGPPPLGLHVLMGRNTPEKIGNMIESIEAGRIAPVELIARKT